MTATPIQAANRDASAAEQGRVFLPKGEYLIDDTITLLANAIFIEAGTTPSEIRGHDNRQPTTDEP